MSFLREVKTESANVKATCGAGHLSFARNHGIITALVTVETILETVLVLSRRVFSLGTFPMYLFKHSSRPYSTCTYCVVDRA